MLCADAPVVHIRTNALPRVLPDQLARPVFGKSRFNPVSLAVPGVTKVCRRKYTNRKAALGGLPPAVSGVAGLNALPPCRASWDEERTERNVVSDDVAGQLPAY